MQFEDIVSFIPWIILLLLALWLLSAGAQGVMSSNTIIGAIFAIIIFLVGLSLLGRTVGGTRGYGYPPRYYGEWY